MSYAEFSVIVDCPHCGNDQHSHAEFNFNEADDNGVKSMWHKEVCNDCDKEFWFNAYLEFNLSIEFTEKKKPKDKK